ncbi:MAG: hypothetical protein ACXVPN_02690 [Bacteroidia bacterium]
MKKNEKLQKVVKLSDNSNSAYNFPPKLKLNKEVVAQLNNTPINPQEATVTGTTVTCTTYFLTWTVCGIGAGTTQSFRPCPPCYF